MIENISLAFQGIWAHKLRSFLTMLGIIIGIAAIITIVATINGTNEQIKENLIGSGTNVVDVKLSQNGYEADFSYSTIPEGIAPADEELRASIDELEGVAETSFYRYRNWVDGVYYKNSSFNGSVRGVDSHYFSVNSYSLTSGRGFTESDHTDHRKVAVVDSKVASSLFSGDDPVGATIELGADAFTVVGVYTRTVTNEPVINSVSDYYMYANTENGSIFIPIESWDIIYKFDEPVNAAIKAVSTDTMTVAGNSAANAMTEALISNDSYEYKAQNLLDQAAALQNLSQAANNQLIWIAAISLLVGGIGVMNIMLVSVTERTREIGLKVAIGARPGRIRIQFLTEAAVLTSVGGLIGVLAGIGLAYLLSHIMETPVAISIPACIIAVVFSMVIGIVFGLVPAVKASRLNPIDALRRE